jgi:hypothetical protein
LDSCENISETQLNVSQMAWCLFPRSKVSRRWPRNFIHAQMRWLHKERKIERERLNSATMSGSKEEETNKTRRKKKEI